MRTNKASATAILVASGVLFTSRAPGRSIEVWSEAICLAEWLLANYSPFTRFLAFVMSRPWLRPIINWVERRTIPGILEHYVRRKQAISRLARKQLLLRPGTLSILGAGFDTLAVQLARRMPEILAIEIDHPATQQWKRRGIIESGLECPRIEFFAEDLSESFPDLLKANRFWVIEGLLMYLQEDRVRNLFQAIRRTSFPGSQIAFTFMEIQANGRVDFRHQNGWVNLWLAKRRESFLWGISREAIEGFLAPLGFRPLEIEPQVTREMDRLDVGEFLALYEIV